MNSNRQHKYRAWALSMALLGAGVGLPSMSAGDSSAIQGLQDPTRPLHVKEVEKAKSAFQLHAIFVRSNGNEAIVNGQRIRKNDRVGQAVITNIMADRVIYLLDGQHHVLWLRPKLSIQPSQKVEG